MKKIFLLNIFLFSIIASGQIRIEQVLTLDSTLTSINQTVDGGVFNGSVDLSNSGGTYYDIYDLEIDGQITFSLSASPEIFNFAYLPIDSDGVTEFATKSNLDAIFDEQYGLPTDRILSEGIHYAYILKTPRSGKASISIPVNSYDPDTTAPVVSSATIEDSEPDELVVVFSEIVNVTNVTGLSLDNDLSGLTVDSFTGSGTDTVTFDLSGDASTGDASDFIYSISNTIEDLSGNALVSGNTAVTNNIASASLVYTLDNFTESPSTEYTKSGSNGYGDGKAVTTTTHTGSFTYRVNLLNSNTSGNMIGISTHGNNVAWNDGATPWDFGVYTPQGTSDIRGIDSGVTGTTYTPPTTLSASSYLEITRDGSDNIIISYDGTDYETLGTLSGAVYFHFQTYTSGGKIYNPEKL